MIELPAFTNVHLLQQALTHRSYVNEHPDIKNHNERLEFLGDAVLNFLSGEFLFKHYPYKPEGELSALRSALVDEKQLAQFAQQLGIGEQLRLGNGAEREGGRQNANLLSSAFEAVIGAYFLDAGSDMGQVRTYVEPLFMAVVEQLANSAASINYKSRFQEWALENTGTNPKYLIVNQIGPDHNREFTAAVWINNQCYGEGKGRRKQDAEKDAARDALQKLGIIG